MTKKRAPQLPTSWDEVPVLMDLVYAARLVGYSPEYLLVLCKPGRKNRFPAGKIGSQWRVEKGALIQYLKETGVMS